jgi:hypothetical protein
MTLRSFWTPAKRRSGSPELEATFKSRRPPVVFRIGTRIGGILAEKSLPKFPIDWTGATCVHGTPVSIAPRVRKLFATTRSTRSADGNCYTPNH